MFKAGIVDPTKVTRSALQNAAIIAGLMLTTEVMITKIKDDEEKGGPRRGVGSLMHEPSRRVGDRECSPSASSSVPDGRRGLALRNRRALEIAVPRSSRSHRSSREFTFSDFRSYD